MDEFPNPIAKASFDRVKPSVEKVDGCLGCRLRLKLRGNVRHGVVSSPALQRRMIRGSSPRRLRHQGKTLVDAKGMTLYIYDRDTAAGKSSCNGNCATNWPPLMAGAGAKDSGSWSVITRDDGGKQWAYKGKPLYFWKDDKKAGDAEGDNRNNVWHIAAP